MSRRPDSDSFAEKVLAVFVILCMMLFAAFPRADAATLEQFADTVPMDAPNDWAAAAPHAEKFLMFGPAFKLRGNLFAWRYNPAGEPAAFAGLTVATIQRAQAKWSAVCGIKFFYLGETSKGFALDGSSVYSWQPMPQMYGAWTTPWLSADGSRITESDIAFNPLAVFGNYLEQLALHETGHAIGIDHSDVPGAIMSGPPHTSYAFPAGLQPDDVAACRLTYGAP